MLPIKLSNDSVTVTYFVCKKSNKYRYNYSSNDTSLLQWLQSRNLARDETFVCENFFARLKVRDCENCKILSILKYEPQKSQKRGLFEKIQHKNAIKSKYFEKSPTP